MPAKKRSFPQQRRRLAAPLRPSEQLFQRSPGRQHDSWYRHQQSPASAGSPSLLPRHSAQSTWRPQFSRTTDQRVGCASPQQSERRHPPARDTAWQGGVRTELPRWRVSVPGWHARLRAVPRAGVRSKVRGKLEKFADHFTQARLFWDSQSVVERRRVFPRAHAGAGRAAIAARRDTGQTHSVL